MQEFPKPCLLAAVLFGLVSCGNDAATTGAAEAAPAPAGFRERSGFGGDDDSGKIMDRFGAFNDGQPNSGRKTASESGTGANQEFKGEFGKREFAAKNYDRKAFWGNKDYARQVYGGDTDGSRFQTRPGEAGRTARDGTLVTNEAGRNFGVDAVPTGTASEGRQGAIERTSDTQTDFRREVFQQPEVTDFRTGKRMTLEESKRILGN